MLRGTLISDGSSDRALEPIIEWTLAQKGASVTVTWADLRVLPSPPKSLAERARKAVELHPCDVLFVHRDAESQPREARRAEVIEALVGHAAPFVCVIPVRMTEAWLLLDAGAVAEAAGNPAAAKGMQLPEPGRWESEPDPKGVLHGLLLQACGLGARRRSRFRPSACMHRLARLIADFAPLRSLPAFRAFEAELGEVLGRLQKKPS